MAAAKEARYDKESVMKFFRMLVRRRYFSDELPVASPWSTSVPRPLQRPGDSIIEEDQLYAGTRISGGDPYKYNVLPPLPAQRNLTPAPTLYPQQPVLTPDNYNIPRFNLSGAQELNSIRSKRNDINV